LDDASDTAPAAAMCMLTFFGLRPSDGWLIVFPAEMKVNFKTPNRLAFVQVTGGNIGSIALPILGGYAVGPAGTAVVSTAYILMGLAVQKGNYQLTFPVHFRYGCSTPRDVVWVVSTSCQAASRNIPMPVIWLGYMAAGSKTKMYFCEAAARLDRKQANDLVLHPLERYETHIGTPPEACTYQECYDVTTGKLGAAYLRLYAEVKEALAGLGIPFD
jgi:hypothetical protein